MFRFCPGHHEKLQIVLLTGSSLYSMNGIFVAWFYLGCTPNVVCGCNALCVCVQGGDNPRPKKKKKLMKKKTKRKGEDFKIPQSQVT